MLFETPVLRDPNDVSGLRDDLDNGLCTVVRVLSPAEVTEYRQKILNVMMEVRPSGKTPHGGKGCGFVPCYGAAQHADVWELRLNKVLKKTMQSIYGTDNLAVSCDNVFFLSKTDGGRNDDSTGERCKSVSARIRKHLASSLPLHKDIGYDTYGSNYESELTRHGLYGHSLQAQITLTPVTASSAGLVVVSGSMAFTDEEHDDLFTNQQKDFCPCTDKAYKVFQNRLVKICVPAGCAIIWRSDRVHANCKADYGVEDPSRVGLFVTWHPRIHNYDRHAKLENIRKGKTGSHWPLLLDRWTKAGSHMSNLHGESRPIFPTFSNELEERIANAI